MIILRIVARFIRMDRSSSKFCAIFTINGNKESIKINGSRCLAKNTANNILMVVTSFQNLFSKSAQASPSSKLSGCSSILRTCRALLLWSLIVLSRAPIVQLHTMHFARLMFAGSHLSHLLLSPSNCHSY